MDKIIFEKAYTRDYSLILEEVWTRALKKEHFGQINPYQTIVIDYINDGMMEVWENQQATDWFIDKLFEENKKNTNFFAREMEVYELILKELKVIWSKNSTSSIKDLKYFISLLSRAMDYFLIFYYSAMNTRNEKNILTRANKLRDEDVLFEKADNFIRSSIENIYPQASGLSNTVLMEELDSLHDISVLKERFKNYVMELDNYSDIISIDNFLKNNPSYQFIFNELITSEKVTGQVAYKGYAKGIVKILKRKNQINDFENGKILISPMTTPDFVPAMKRAVAIVTDEGGITCHAAIISRELKIPCVIGTKIATKVFKDGDMVEVDANRGVIRKIK